MTEPINGLILREFKNTQPVTVQISEGMEIENWEKQIQKEFGFPGTYVAYFDHQAHIGRWDGTQFHPPEAEEPFPFIYLKELRLFEKNRELYLWRTAKGWQGRLREDIEGQGQFCMDCTQKLWGRSFTKEGQTYMQEGRGIYFPIHSALVKESGGKLEVQVRAYITENGTGQSGYADFRMVSLEEV